MTGFFSQDLLFGLMGGLGLFLFGMKIMSEGLQKVAGNRMRKILAALTNNRYVAAFVGLAVTAIIQSSSATTVMVVGFVNAGLMSLVQAIGVVLGANIGTTITAQLIAFKITKFALPAIGIGTLMKLFCKDKKNIYLGEILLGFGILFYGMSVMKEAFDPIKGSEQFRQVFLLVDNHPLLAVAIGALMTVIVQSSSATIGITLALATSGLISFEGSVALILGENIGTTVTANLAAIGTNVAARRTALSHFLFNFLGVTYMLVLLPYFVEFVNAITPGDADLVVTTQQQAHEFGLAVGDKPYIARHIANTHTLFNIINTLVFLPIIGVLANLATRLVPGKDSQLDFQLKYIDSRVLNTPPLALSQARSETNRMALLALECVDETLQFLDKADLRMLESLRKKEDLLDLLQREIIDFLVAISQRPISQEASREISSLMHVVNDLEKIGDYCENLWQLGERRIEQRIRFSSVAEAEVVDLAQKTREFVSFIQKAFERRDQTIIEKAQFMENQIDTLEAQLRDNHIQRLNTGECSVNPGLIFIDMIHNFEKIGDHTHSIARAIIGKK
ncbi:Na/Pi cotransporter family protein [Desulfuromonas thiophila]|uniref:Phosphate:Na+ symporter n=1 Tax=Desulfuromonas thiophila TaxID=57664 RepID=A0A1G7AHC1_9BACT|nr:Na/Pi cotransporter family protein [Desulfuromonas thiophila]SDE14199.1 phosphate:Na+ symporter [Desulfuromonas thiophila]